MNVANMFVKCLENEGVEYIFGVPGEENEDLLFALEDSTIQFVPTRHENGASFMANVWGRLTGKAGVCLSTLGPGATNLITGVADAYLDKSPVVALTGQADLERMHSESHQYLDVVNMFRPITKWNTAISDPDIVPDVIRKAFKVAEMEKPGSTHIELSEDVAKMEAKGEPLRVSQPVRSAPDMEALQQAAQMLKKARKPLIFAGNGAIRILASKYLRNFVERLQIPVVHTFMGKGAVSYRCDQSLLTIGLGFADYVMEAVKASDLIVTVGYDIGEYAPCKWNPNNDAKIIHIDSLPAEVYTHYQPQVEIACDISEALLSLDQMINEEDCHFDTEWYKPIRQRILADIKSYDLKSEDPFTIPGALNIIQQYLGNQGLLISDVGSHKMWIARNYLTSAPNSCIISNGLASMGIALPGGIAAALTNPKRKIVAAMGDGGFMMNSQEIETAKRLGVGFTIIVFNDNDYGLISWKQQMSQGHSTSSTRISNPDFKAYAESFGIKAYKPETLPDLKEQLKEAIESRELCMVVIDVDPAVNTSLYQKLKKDMANF